MYTGNVVIVRGKLYVLNRSPGAWQFAKVRLEKCSNNVVVLTQVVNGSCLGTHANESLSDNTLVYVCVCVVCVCVC